MKTYLIDDDIISNFVTEKVLQDEQFADEIISFSEPEVAFLKLKESIPDNLPNVVFLDLNMPGMSGWDFLDGLEPYKQELIDKCRIYILTSSLDIADTSRSQDYDLVHGLLHKPIDFQDVKVIQEELRNEA